MANNWDKETRREYRDEVNKLAGHNDNMTAVAQTTLEGEIDAAKARFKNE